MTEENTSRFSPKLVIGGMVIALTLVGLVGWAMGRPGSTTFYYSTSEVVALGPTTGPDEVRVNGKVVPGSIVREGLLSTFVLTDGDATIEVATSRPLPDTLKANSDVVARGSFDGRTFTASEVLAKCPSKFKARA